MEVFPHFIVLIFPVDFLSSHLYSIYYVFHFFFFVFICFMFYFKIKSWYKLKMKFEMLRNVEKICMVWYMYRISDICCYKMYIFCLENNHQTSVCLLIHKYRIYRIVKTCSRSRHCLGKSPSSYQPPAFIYYRLTE